jgi:colanic acid/amylovoran biosynthesis glycosyltransferase
VPYRPARPPGTQGSVPPAPSPPVTYLTTHFPYISHTFIASEIEALERRGVPVVTVSINSPREHDTLDEANRQWARRTHYLKATAKLTVMRLVLATVLRRPSVLAIPLRLGGFDLKAYLWGYFQLVEAILLHRVMRVHGSRHVHAHHGQAPATIAWFATDVGNRLDQHGPSYTWSVTIHGWHELMDQQAARLREKMAAASFVVCISDFTRSQLLRITDPAEWDKVHVVRCGVDLDRLTQRPPAPVGDPARVAIVARVSPEKGHLVLLQALRFLLDRGVSVHVDVVGPGERGFEDDVRATVERLGLTRHVTMHGAADPERIANLLEESDVFCLPSFAEGLPVSIMEAMARGVPVVTTYISGIPELAIDGETALVVPAARPDLLADAIEAVLRDDDLRQHLVKQALARVTERHDIAVVSEALAGLLESRR